MCGIFGIVAGKKAMLSPDYTNSMMDTLAVLSSSRGKEAAGTAALIGDTLHIYKEARSSREFIQSKQYKHIFQSIKNGTHPLGLIGHSRLATNGLQTENINNQPVVTKKVVGIHNGIIVNEDRLWKIINKRPKFEVDTEALFELASFYHKKKESVVGALGRTFSTIEGSASIAVFFQSSPGLYLATNTGSIFYAVSDNSQLFLFASEKYILQEFLNKHLSGTSNKIIQLKPGKGVRIDYDDLQIDEFDLKITRRKQSEERKGIKFKVNQINSKTKNSDKVLNLYSKKNNLERLKKHDFDYAAIKKLKRCSKCVLPETMTFIDFDKKGVCNYCRHHQKIKYKGKQALEKLVEPFRSKNGEPDCIIAFSGGRDSSYGLHFLKKELGMNPIAYTYDWGMVTDLARRNEARMVGKLGVEHIIVSADITMKRDHINKHIRAWMNKPDLGMVPLFMEGDKQCEYHADDLSNKTGVKLIFYCRGNEFENEEFKWGHCGITKATPKGVIHNLSLKGKAQIARYYAWQYFTNSAYINSSIGDTLFAFFSTYVQKHDYVFLWHYIPWYEKKIISTLTKTYGWEVPTETKATWRTDDGTSAFYNYIYMSGQGFTENDTFRSNQIREGIIKRKDALTLVHEENKPRYKALTWYFDRVGLDGGEVLSVVDKMPKKY